MKNLEDILKRVARTGLLAVAIAASLSCSKDKDKSKPDTTDYIPPFVSVVQAPADGYGNFNLKVYAFDNVAVEWVNVFYTKASNSETNGFAMNYTGSDENGVGIYETTTTLDSDAYSMVIEALDSSGNLSAEVPVSFRRWATEAESDSELEGVLASRKSAGAIADYLTETVIDCDGNMIAVDYAVIPATAPRQVAGWYQGESDGNHFPQKAILDHYAIPWSQLQPCTKPEIGQKIDYLIQQDFPSGTIVE
jgi:hypothetical protein